MWLRLQKSFDLIQVCNNLLDFAIGKHLTAPTLQSFYDFISLNYNAAMYGALKMDKLSKRKFLAELRNNRHLIKCLRDSSQLKYIFEGYLFTIFGPQTRIYSVLKSFKG